MTREKFVKLIEREGWTVDKEYGTYIRNFVLYKKDEGDTTSYIHVHNLIMEYKNGGTIYFMAYYKDLHYSDGTVSGKMRPCIYTDFDYGFAEVWL